MVNNNSPHLSEEFDFIYAGAALICVCCAATAAGMTTGLLSIDTLKLKIRQQVGTPKEQSYASTILPLLKNHHWLLCTLLIYNAVATEALPIFLDGLVPSWAAVLISVTLVLLFGEVIPTALFTGPNQLAIAANFAPLVRLVQIIFYPVAYPMSLLLDCILGREDDSEMYTREEISAMMNILRNNAMENKFFAEEEEDDDDETPLSNNEVNVITGVLSLAKMCIRDVAIPMDKVNMLSSEQVFDSKTIAAIDQVGHSRLPVFRGADTTDFVGFFLVKRLINVSPEAAEPLSTMELKPPLVVGASQSLLDVLNVFQTGHSHMALVSEQPNELRAAIARMQPPPASAAAIGILTIEDIFEAMLQSEIFDEDDREKGQYKEEASMALREMSLRSSVSVVVGGGGGGGKGGHLDELAAAALHQTGDNSGKTSQGPLVVVSNVGQGLGLGVGVGLGDHTAQAASRCFEASVFQKNAKNTGRSPLRAMSEAPSDIRVMGRSSNSLGTGSGSGGSGNQAKWLAQRASTRSVGSALHSGGHHSDGSMYAPLLAQLGSDLLQDDPGSEGVAMKKTRVTPSLVTKYIKKRSGGTGGGVRQESRGQSRGESSDRDRALSQG